MTALELMDKLYERMNNCTSTSGRRYNFDQMKEVYDTCDEVKTVWDFVEKAHKLVDRFVKKVVETVKKVVKAVVNNSNSISYDVPVENRPCAYIDEMYNDLGELVWLKIGKAKDIVRRTKEHLNAKGYEDITHIVVRKLFFVDSEDDALTMENALRKHYKSKEDCGFIRNDRFTNCQYDADDITADTRIAEQYKLCAE